MTDQYSVITQALVAVNVTSSVNSFGTERRFQKDITIADLKGKLELLTGSTAGCMRLELYNNDNKLICPLDNDDAVLGSYPVDDRMRVHVIDSTLRAGEFEDLSKVEKYEMGQDDYDKRADTVKAFKERNKLGRFKDADPEEKKRQEEEKAKKESEEKKKAESMKVGDRCEVTVAGQSTKRGTVRFVGETDFKPGYWIGVQYDEPVGKNNGSVQGKQYFECPPKYGGFVKPQNVTVGDFPEEDLGFSDDDEM